MVINSSVAAKASENINISIIVKSGTHDVVEWIIATQRVIIARPIVRPLPLALGGGGEESEKGGEESQGDLCLFHIVGF